MLTDDQLQRYSRQLLLPQIDIAGQEKLTASSVLIVGAGGLGNPAALYLAGAGVGRLQLVDDDQVEVSNLHRQIGFREVHCGRNKVDALREQLQALNPEVAVAVYTQRVDENWLADAVGQVDLVLDCTDNFATRNHINRACVAARVPLISAAAIRFSGQLLMLDLRRSDCPCAACLFGENETGDEPCSESGILGPVVGTLGTLQALEAIKLLAGMPSPPLLLTFDGLSLAWKRLPVQRDRNCPVCSQ